MKMKIFNINLLKKDSIKLRWGDHTPGGKLSMFFGIPSLRKNFKITPGIFTSPSRVGSKQTVRPP